MPHIEIALDGLVIVPVLAAILFTKTVPLIAGIVALFATDDRRAERAMTVLKATTTPRATPLRARRSPNQPAPPTDRY